MCNIFRSIAFVLVAFALALHGYDMVLSDFTYDVEGGQLVLCGLAKDRGEALASEPSLVIPDSFDVGGDVALDVSVLGDGLFADFTNLVSVDLPGRLSVIGGQCFSGCSSLAQVSIPVSVVSVGNWAFGGCADDLAVTFLGAYPTEMDDNAFGYGTTVCFDDAQAGWEDAISSVEYCDVRYVRSYALANGQSSEMTLDGVPCVVKWYLDQAGTGAVIYGISLKESDEPTSVKKLELPSALGGKPLVEVDYCALQGLPVSESIVVPATVKAIRPFGVSCDYYPSGYPTGLMVYFMAEHAGILGDVLLLRFPCQSPSPRRGMVGVCGRVRLRVVLPWLPRGGVFLQSERATHRPSGQRVPTRFFGIGPIGSCACLRGEWSELPLRIG